MRRKAFIWGLLGFVAVGIICAGMWRQQQRMPAIVIPPRQYPPNNAYDAYKQIAQMWRDQQRQDRHLQEIERRLFDRGAPVQEVSPEDRAYYLQKRRPFLEAYRAHLKHPSVAVYEYDILWLFPELSLFRSMARAESLMIRDALAAGRAKEAVQRASDLTRFAEQIRADGADIHYLVGSAIINIGLAPIREGLPQIQSPDALDALVELAQRYEQQRTPLRQIAQNEYYFGLSVYRDLQTGKLTPRDLEATSGNPLAGNFLEEWLLNSGIMIRRSLRPSLEEFQNYYDALFAELEKPSWARTPPRAAPRHWLSNITIPVLDQTILREMTEVATVRLLGCAAAVKRWRQQHGAYPPSLEVLQLGELIIDPFTGKPFVYRVDARRGFLLYSVGENRLDDGGRLSPESRAGDLLPVSEEALPEKQRPSNTRLPSPPVWLR